MGSTPFLVNDQGSITFAEAEDISKRLATGLEQLGIHRGDCVTSYWGRAMRLINPGVIGYIGLARMLRQLRESSRPRVLLR